MKSTLISLVVLLFLAGELFGQAEIKLSIATSDVFTFDDGSPFGATFALTPIEVPPDQITLLQTPNVLSELELVEDQKTELASRIAALNKAYETKRMAYQKKVEARGNNPPDHELVLESEELGKQYREDVKKAAEDILLPFQLDRLRQIRLQAELRCKGSRGVESEAFADLLQLTDEQKEALQKKAAEAEKNLEQEIKELRRKRHREVLEDVLTKSQLRTLDEHLGEPMAETSDNPTAKPASDKR